MSTSVEFGTVVWPCESNYLTCPGGHVYSFKSAGMKHDMRRLEGHDFFRCEKCTPASHFFVVFSKSPDPHATCYLISEECWREWSGDKEPRTLSTVEMLHLIRDPLGRSYNPNFRR